MYKSQGTDRLRTVLIIPRPRTHVRMRAAFEAADRHGHEDRAPLLAAASSADDEIHAVVREVPFAARLRKRAGLLIALLVFQSCSSFILSTYEQLLQRHSVVVFFLTMLVGAGGNAGNQAAVLVIRGLATGEIDARTSTRYIWGEVKMALCIAAAMVAAGYLRVTAFGYTTRDAVAISSSLLAIVFSSVIIGTLLPLLLHRMGCDPAHAGATIQVIMDLAGVLITCVVCSTLL